MHPREGSLPWKRSERASDNRSSSCCAAKFHGGWRWAKNLERLQSKKIILAHARLRMDCSMTN